MAIFVLNMLLPISTLLNITRMNALNHLFDADLDRISGKTDRPIPSEKVSKRQALVFVELMNFIGLAVPTLANNLAKISLKDNFFIKTCAIAIAMGYLLLLGASAYLRSDSMVYKVSWWTGGQVESQIL